MEFNVWVEVLDGSQFPVILANGYLNSLRPGVLFDN